MSGSWNIDVASSGAVMEAVRSSMTGLDHELTALGSAVGGVLLAVPPAVVQDAFAGVMELGVEPKVRGMLDAGNTALSGTAEALSHYAHGDLAMAATAMRSAAAVPDALTPGTGRWTPVIPGE